MRFALPSTAALLAASLSASPAFGGSMDAAIQPAAAGDALGSTEAVRDAPGEARALSGLANWYISFEELVADYSHGASEQLSLRYEIGEEKDHWFEWLVYEKDCKTLLGQYNETMWKDYRYDGICEDPITACSWVVVSSALPDELEIKYSLNKTSLASSNVWNGTHIELCQEVRLVVPANATAGTERMVVVEDVREVDVAVGLSIGFEVGPLELVAMPPFLVMTIPGNRLNIARMGVPGQGNTYTFAMYSRILEGALRVLINRALGPGKAAQLVNVTEIRGNSSMTEIDYDMTTIESCYEVALCEALKFTTTMYTDIVTYMTAAYASGEFATILMSWIQRVLKDEGYITRRLAAPEGLHLEGEGEEGLIKGADEDSKSLTSEEEDEEDRESEGSEGLIDDASELISEVEILADRRLMLNFGTITGFFGTPLLDIDTTSGPIRYTKDNVDVASYVSACKCAGLANFTCDDGALVPNEELFLCISSAGPEIEIKELESMLLTQGDDSLTVVSGGDAATPAITAVEYTPTSNGVAVSTRAPTNIFNFSETQSVNVTGVVQMMLASTATGRRLRALQAGGEYSSEFELEVSLAGEVEVAEPSFDEVVLGSGAWRVAATWLVGVAGLVSSFAAV